MAPTTKPSSNTAFVLGIRTSRSLLVIATAVFAAAVFSNGFEFVLHDNNVTAFRVSLLTAIVLSVVAMLYPVKKPVALYIYGCTIIIIAAWWLITIWRLNNF